MEGRAVQDGDSLPHTVTGFPIIGKSLPDIGHSLSGTKKYSKAVSL